MGQAFAEDKLEREASHTQVKTLFSAASDLFSDGLNKCRVPEDFIVGPLPKKTQRFVGESGSVMVKFDSVAVAGGSRDHPPEPVIPDAFRDLNHFKKHIRLVNHVVDRSSVNVSSLNFLINGEGYLMGITYGLCHDLWNAIKGAAKKKLVIHADGKVSTLVVWRSVVLFASVANMNHGPFRSGVWGSGKQAALTRIGDTRGPECADIQLAAKRQAALLGQSEPSSPDEFQSWFAELLRQRSCHEAGPILKFARWLSVDQVWQWYRPTIHLLRPVLEELAGTSEQLSVEIASNSTAQHDAELAQRMTTSKTGLVQRAPHYITESLCLHLDIFSCVTRPLGKYYSFRTSEIKTPQQGLDENLVFAADGRWYSLLQDVLFDAFVCGQNLRSMGATVATEPAERRANIDTLTGFAWHVVSEACVRFFPQMDATPHSTIKFLHSHIDRVVRPAVEDHSWQWTAILALEEMAARGSAPAIRVLATLPQRESKLVRMQYLYLEQEEGTRTASTPPGVGEITRHLATAVAVRFPDEKVVENVNGFIRDLTRQRRSKRVPMTSIHNRIIQSGVIAARGMSGPGVTLAEVAGAKDLKAAASATNATTTMYQPTVPVENWDFDRLDRIELAGKDWASPAVQAHALEIMSYVEFCLLALPPNHCRF